MSSEGKAKRGTAGQAHARNNPFRINGWPPNWQAQRRGAVHARRADSSGSTFMRGLLGGVVAQNLGLGKMVGDYDVMIEHAQRRVTHPLLKID